MMDDIKIDELKKICNQMRKDIVEMTYSTGRSGAHIGGALSIVEILAVLYTCVADISKNNVCQEKRDRIILSKGHGVLAQYSILSIVGILARESLTTYKSDDSLLYAHPMKGSLEGIEFSTGSLGQGLALGIGSALALKKKGIENKVFVILGDGECNEGSVWEAAAFAGAKKLDNLIVIVDNNHLQYDCASDEVVKIDSLAKIWSAFGFQTKEVDGHSIEELYDALCVQTDLPLAIVADTIKGKGISFMEGNPIWHASAMSIEQYNNALRELE